MDFFCADIKLVDLIHIDYHVLPIINRFGIKLGFGDLTVRELCEKNEVDVDFFLTIINIYHNESLVFENELQKFPLPFLIEFLKKSHEYYKKFVVSKNNSLFLNLVENNYNNIYGIDSIKEVYVSEINKFHDHMEYEDKVIFPHLLSLKNIADTDGVLEPCNTFPELDSYHDCFSEKLYDMTNILMKYMKPENDDNSTNELLFSVFDFIRDLKIHTKIEKVVFNGYTNN